MIPHQSSGESQPRVNQANDRHDLHWKAPHVVEVPHELPGDDDDGHGGEDLQGFPPNIERILSGQVEHTSEVDVVHLGLVRVHLPSVIVNEKCAKPTFTIVLVDSLDTSMSLGVLLSFPECWI